MKLLTALALAAGIFLGGAGTLCAQELVNEIGGVTIEGNSKVNMFRPEKEQEVIPRNFQKQPPLIPHSIKGYNITQNFNKCMDCHSKERAEETIDLRHEIDRPERRKRKRPGLDVPGALVKGTDPHRAAVSVNAQLRCEEEGFDSRGIGQRQSRRFPVGHVAPCVVAGQGNEEMPASGSQGDPSAIDLRVVADDELRRGKRQVGIQSGHCFSGGGPEDAVEV